MTDDNEVEPQDKSGFKFSTTIRLVAIALGIVSATILAQRGFHITFNNDFVTFLGAVDDVLGGLLSPVEKYAIHPALALLRRVGIQMELQSHWKYSFILLWVWMGAIARVFGKGAPWPEAAFLWGGGGFCALLGGVLAGAVGADWLTFPWLTAFSLYFALMQAAYANRNDYQSWIMSFGPRGLFAVVLTGVSFALTVFGPRIGFLARINSRSNFGLVFPVSIVIGMGLGLPLLALIHRERSSPWLSSDIARVGIDILSVLGGAAFITLIAHELA